MDRDLYIGIISGTSMDGIDLALVEFQQQGHTLIASNSHPWPAELQQQLRSISQPGDNEIDRLGVLDAGVADEIATGVTDLLQQAALEPQQITAIGSHGQTIRHRPEADIPFTLQIGDPNRIAELTGITTIADFRRRDMAAGGQGAPLVCAFHEAVFRNENENRAILNIGGIANLTMLPGDRQKPVSGFDTGPGNTLMDTWVRLHLNSQYDDAGSWGASGSSYQPLLDEMLKDPYLQLAPPKSTGPEHFNLAWLDTILSRFTALDPRDVQATLTEFTATTVAQAIGREAMECGRIIVCGGGVHNDELMRKLQAQLGETPLDSSSTHGIDPDQVEATAFAWLARQTLLGLPGNIPAVTGASGPRILGGIFPGRQGVG